MAIDVGSDAMVASMGNGGDNGKTTSSGSCRRSTGVAKGGGNTGGERVATSVNERESVCASCDKEAAAPSGSDSGSGREAASEICKHGEKGTASKHSDGGEGGARTSGGCDGAKEGEAMGRGCNGGEDEAAGKDCDCDEQDAAGISRDGGKEDAASKNSEAGG